MHKSGKLPPFSDGYMDSSEKANDSSDSFLIGMAVTFVALFSL
jgi:hypothetical protein